MTGNGNGNAVGALVADINNMLAPHNVVDYHIQPIPIPLDEQLLGWVEQIMGLTAVDRKTLLNNLTSKSRSLFGIYGHRAATLSQRQEDKELLLKGLVAYAIANYEIPDNRRLEIALAVYHHCAMKLSMNPVDLFAEASTYTSTECGLRFIAFGRRADVTLNRFGWRSVNTDDGVKFEFKGRF